MNQSRRLQLSILSNISHPRAHDTTGGKSMCRMISGAKMTFIIGQINNSGKERKISEGCTAKRQISGEMLIFFVNYAKLDAVFLIQL